MPLSSCTPTLSLTSQGGGFCSSFLLSRNIFFHNYFDNIPVYSDLSLGDIISGFRGFYVFTRNRCVNEKNGFINSLEVERAVNQALGNVDA